MQKFFFTLLILSLGIHAWGVDSFKELIAVKKEGVDFKVNQRPQESSVLVMAIHGGTIEPGTTELADAIAAEQYSYYSFTGLKNDYTGLHLSSTKFDEPRLLHLLENSSTCLALHGLKDDKADFCVGGASINLRKRFLEILSREFPSFKTCELCCPPNSGISSNNVVNRCKVAGVQIEMGSNLRSELLKDRSFLKKLSKIMQQELSQK